MNKRATELAHFAASIHWLSPAEAHATSDILSRVSSTRHVGLNDAVVLNIEYFRYGDDAAAGTSWLRRKLSAALPLVVIFGRDDSFRCDSTFLLECWQDVFVPARDDAIVYSEFGSLVLFVSHECAFEVGQRPL